MRLGGAGSIGKGGLWSQPGNQYVSINQSINQRNLYSASYSPERQRLTTKTLRRKSNDKT